MGERSHDSVPVPASDVKTDLTELVRDLLPGSGSMDSAGQAQSMEALLPQVYDELRGLAASYLRRERPDHTLQPTALVHEVYLRLASDKPVDWQNRAHFLGVAARIMRREVESFLDRQATGLEKFAQGAGAWRDQHPGAAAQLGRRLGAYELASEVGRGGIGAVYLARRADGRFEQQVAVKLLKRGTDTEEVLRRFHAERRILARLEHPNIARLLDGGETGDGLPFFVMEYVPGTPLTRFADEHGLSVRATCRAVPIFPTGATSPARCVPTAAPFPLRTPCRMMTPRPPCARTPGMPWGACWPIRLPCEKKLSA